MNKKRHNKDEVIFTDTNESKPDYENVPMGLTMALAQNLEAMRRFFALDDEERQRVIKSTENIDSKEEMRFFVENDFKLSDGNT